MPRWIRKIRLPSLELRQSHHPVRSVVQAGRCPAPDRTLRRQGLCNATSRRARSSQRVRAQSGTGRAARTSARARHPLETSEKAAHDRLISLLTIPRNPCSRCGEIRAHDRLKYTVGLYFRFPLSVWLVEGTWLERGTSVSYETIRPWPIGKEIRTRLCSSLAPQAASCASARHYGAVSTRRATTGGEPSRTEAQPAVVNSRVRCRTYIFHYKCIL